MWTKFYIQFTPCLVTPVDFLVNPHPPLLVHVVIACPHTKIKKAKLFSKIDSSWSIFRTILCLFFREGDAIYYAFWKLFLKGKLEENLDGHRNAQCQVCIVRMVAKLCDCSFELFWCLDIQFWIGILGAKELSNLKNCWSNIDPIDSSTMKPKFFQIAFIKEIFECFDRW